MHLRLPSAIIVATLFSSAVPAAQPQGSRVPTGTASITGRVIDRESRQPLDQIVVSLTAATGMPQALSTLTDAEGTFRFEGIGAGKYRIVASSDGFAATRYGQSDLGGSPDEIVHVDAGEARKLLDLALVRAGAITGRVTDATGAPLKDVSVSAFHVIAPRTYRLQGDSASSRSNAHGEYTVANLAPGIYQVMAQRVDREAMRAGANSDPRPVFYPGVVRADDALAVRVASGETAHRIDIVYPSTDRVRLSGHLLRGSVNGPITANLLSRGTSVRTLPVDAEGRFELTYLSPGLYTIWATSHADGSTEAATLTIQIDSDTTDLSLPLQATGRISGRVSTVDGAPLPSGSLQIAAILSAGGEPIDPLPRDRTDIANDGSFELSGLLGERVLRVTGLDPSWQIERITHGRTPVRTLTIPPGEALHDITVMLSQR